MYELHLNETAEQVYILAFECRSIMLFQNGQIKNLAAGLAVLHFPVVDYNKEELIIQSRSSNWLRDIHRNDSDWITNYLSMV